MTILPPIRPGNSNNEEKGDSSPQNVAKDRSVRLRDDHNISHTVASLNDSNATTSRRPQFSFNGSPSERKERSFRKRYKESKIDRPRDREREREQMREVRREQKRDRKAKREMTGEQNLENSAPSSSVDSAIPEPACNNLENEMNLDSQNDEDVTGFNSEDEYDRRISIKGQNLTDEEWTSRDTYFSRCLLTKLGFEIKQMEEDGACLFRAIADQVYGDQDLHFTVRTQCMDYIVKNKDFFASYVTEDFDKYVARKRNWYVHGNHLEIQALSEMYNRTIEVYCYHTEPINIFNGGRINSYEPIRVSYHRMCHYNSINNPNKPSVLVGLGLPNYFTRYDLDRRQIHDAVLQSEETLIEQTMLEDKIKATDWEATSEALEEQVARESYIQFYLDTERRLKSQGHSHAVAGSSSTITSAMCSSPRSSRRGSVSPKGGMSPKGGSSPKYYAPAGTTAPTSISSSGSLTTFSSDRNLNSSYESSKNLIPYVPTREEVQFDLEEKAASSDIAYNNGAYNGGRATSSENVISQRGSPQASCSTSAADGYDDWDERIIAQAIAASQQTYLDELKKRYGSPGPSTSR